MVTRLAALIAAGLLFAHPRCTQEGRTSSRPGPAPTWSEFNGWVSGVRASLLDPSSAQIEWPFGMYSGL